MPGPELDVPRLDAYAAELLRGGAGKALAVALTDRDRTVATRTYGAAASDALWQIGSIGKSVTAVVTLQLVEQGILALDAPVADYLPWFGVRSDFAPITLHHLLNHTAGLIGTSDLAPASNYDVIALADTEAGFAPGQHRLYSNIGYRLVGVVLEVVTGKTFAELVQERVLDRLGMDHSTPAIVHDTRRRLAGGFVPFYDDRPWRPEHGLVPAPWIESADADGCLCCTPADLATYLRALWNDSDGRLMSPAMVRLMKSPMPPHGDEDDGDGYGYGLDVNPEGFGHGGDMIGYVSHMWADHDSGVGVVAFATGIYGAWALAEAASAIARGEEPAKPALTLAEPLVDDGSCPPSWQPYLGRYRAHNPWQPTFHIAACAGELILATDWMDSQRLVLAPLVEATFRVGGPDWSPERLRFDTVIDGRAQRATLSGMPYYRAFTS